MKIRYVLASVAMAGLVVVLDAILAGGIVQAQTERADGTVAAAPATAPSIPWWSLSPQAKECSENGYYLGLAILNYASQHEWRLPPDLGATLPYVQSFDRQSGALKAVPSAEAVKYFLCPQDRARLAVPAVPTPEWINRNTSYAYLGGADVNVDALTEEQFDSAVMLHEKAGGTHPEMAGNLMAFPLNGDAPQPQTVERIAWSRQVLDATRSVPFAAEGQPALARMWAMVQVAPKASECARNQSQIGKAIAIYMNQHRGYYPPTLGDTLPYILSCARRDPLTGQDVALTPQQAARIYLCSQDQDIEIPQDVTPEWINEHTSFVYLGDETLTEDADPQAAILYERLDRGHGDAANMLFADLHAQAFLKDQAQAMIDRSIVMLEADRDRMAAKAAEQGGNGAAAPSGRSRRPVDPNAARLESLRRLMKMVVEDTQDRRGRLPEDLIDVFRFATRSRGPKAPWRLSPQVAARLLLSPRALKDLKVPEEPSKAWLEEKASYAYLGDKRLTVDLMQTAIPAARWSEVVLLHEKPVEGDSQVAVATLDLVCRLVEAKKASAMIDQSKRTLAAAREVTASAASQPVGTASQPAGQALHPAQRWRGRPADDARQTAAAAKGQAEGKTK